MSEEELKEVVRGILVGCCMAVRSAAAQLEYSILEKEDRVVNLVRSYMV